MWQIKKSPIFEIYTCISHNIIYFITQSENLINYWQKENIKNVRVWIYKYVSYNIIMAINNNNWKKALIFEYYTSHGLKIIYNMAEFNSKIIDFVI